MIPGSNARVIPAHRVVLTDAWRTKLDAWVLRKRIAAGAGRVSLGGMSAVVEPAFRGSLVLVQHVVIAGSAVTAWCLLVEPGAWSEREDLDALTKRSVL